MPDQDFVRRAKAKATEKQMAMCWACRSSRPRNHFVVMHNPKRGLCDACYTNYCSVGRAKLHTPSYWTRDWPANWVGRVGRRYVAKSRPVSKQCS